MKKYTIAVDVDEVCAALLPEWLRRYNRDYGDHLLPEMIDGWDLSTQVKPQCGQRMYDYLRDPDLYEYIMPIFGARSAIERLREAGHRVVFVTSCAVGTTDAKVAWLIRWGFLPDKRFQPDFIAAADKSMVMAHALVDDHAMNLKNFIGYKFLVTQPHNRGVTTIGHRVSGLPEAADLILSGEVDLTP